jgi:hypothetical protein
MQVGTKFGAYEIIAKLGEGGMGEVYRARDARLNRDVALKVLPELFALDPDRLARFRREAQLLASLNHPNIAAIHGLEASASVQALVLELVEGPTLADRLAGGAIPLDEALPIARQIAEALEAAHDQGIIHRDLKPANIKLRPDGTVKVLDFGLAKALEPADTMTGTVATSPTITSPALTQMGVILGTAAYMSPEQVKGQQADKRSDIWAFGCVVYESLTARRPFDGETISDTIARILERDVDWSALPPATPPAVRDLLRRCLQKNVRKRQRDIGDVRIELENQLAGTSLSSGLIPAPMRDDVPMITGRARRFSAVAAFVALGAVVGAGLAFVGFRSLSPETGALGAKRLSAIVPPAIRATDVGILPDNRLVIVGFGRKADGIEDARPRMFVRRLDEPDFKPLPGTEGIKNYAASPDGAELAVVSTLSEQSSQRQVIKVRADATTAAVRVSPWNDGWSSGFTWMSDGDLVVTTLTKGGWMLVRVPLDGGSVKPAVKLDTGAVIGIPQVGRPLPDGRNVFLQIQRIGEDGYHADLWVADTTTGKATMVKEDAGNAIYLPTGHLVFTRRNTLMAAPFDVASRTITGGDVGLDAGLRTPNVWGPAPFTVSNSGTLAYLPGGVTGGDRRLSIIAANGQVIAANDERRPFLESLFVLTDERRVSVVIPNTSGTLETWIADLKSQSLRPAIALPRGDATKALWSPKGDLVAFFSLAFHPEDGIHVKRGDEPSKALVRFDVGQDPPTFSLPTSWAPDGSGLIVTRVKGGSGDLLFLPISPTGDGGTPRELQATAYDEGGARFSPDGRLVAFVSNESGRREVYVAAYHKDGTLGSPQKASQGAAPSAVRVNSLYSTTPLGGAGTAASCSTGPRSKRSWWYPFRPRRRSGSRRRRVSTICDNCALTARLAPSGTSWRTAG